MAESANRRSLQLKQNKQGFICLAFAFFGGSVIGGEAHPLFIALTLGTVLFAWWAYKVGMAIDSIEKLANQIEIQTDPQLREFEQQSLNYQLKQSVWEMLSPFQ